jgi:Protein of unknown function (DUF2695)
MFDDAILTPQHPKWPGFCHVLQDRLATTGGCDGSFGHTRAILAITGMDVDASLMFYKVHGAGCDCEILMNVEQAVQCEAVRWN